MWTYIGKKQRHVKDEDSPELGHEDADAKIYAPRERFLEEADEPEGRLRFAFCPLQFCAGTLIIARNARTGHWHFK